MNDAVLHDRLAAEKVLGHSLCIRSRAGDVLLVRSFLTVGRGQVPSHPAGLESLA